VTPRIALLCFLAAPTAFSAQAQMLHMMEANPAARSVMRAQAQEFFVRFDGPVDHQASRLMIQQGDVVLRTLRPRLGASPNTLYAVAGSLPPGDYVLRWIAAPRAGGVPSQGGLDFTVR
jgi:methionine-rich copper-binding protein CopC